MLDLNCTVVGKVILGGTVGTILDEAQRVPETEGRKDTKLSLRVHSWGGGGED